MRQSAVLVAGIIGAAVTVSCTEATMWITTDRGGTILD
jgi:hypothetical protein